MIYLSDIKVGMRVKILKCPTNKYKNRDLIGMLGTVRSTYRNSIAVKVDGESNSYSIVKCFYFTPSCLEAVEETENNINNMEENNMSKITNYLKAVKIRFIDGARTCDYIYASFDDVEVGDLVVVQPAHHAITLARVEEVMEGAYETCREVVCKVDTSAYDERVRVRVRQSELKAKMQERARQLQDIALYQMLAESDPEMKALVEEYQTVLNV